jgi:hypothetical protein
MRRSLPTYAVCAALFVLSFISFQYNALRVAAEGMFMLNQADADQAVLDGILRTQVYGEKPRLGHYTRPDRPDQDLHVYELFEERNTSGAFVEYRSHFGLTADLFAFLHLELGMSVEQMHMFCSTLMAAVVVLFFAGLKSEFSTLGSVLFSGALLTSPWVVTVARNLYWVEATIFIPMLLSVWLGRQATGASPGTRIALTTALFAAFLLRFLCGFEFSTTVVLAAAVPVVYFAIKYARERLIQLLAFVALASVGAFVVAAMLMAGRYFDSLAQGLDWVRLTAEKRLYARDPETVAMEACAKEADPPGCTAGVIKSLRASPLAVLRTYFFFPHSFIPGFAQYWESIDSGMKSELLDARKQWSVRLFAEAFRRYGVSAILPALSVFMKESLLLLLLMALVFVKALSRRTPWHGRAMMAVAFAAPVSWFVIGKGHSDEHYHMNYIIWYVPFVPLSLLFLVEPGIRSGFIRSSSRVAKAVNHKSAS